MTRPGSGSGPDDGRASTGSAVDPVPPSARRARGRHAAPEDGAVLPALPSRSGSGGRHAAPQPGGRRRPPGSDEDPNPSATGPGYGRDEPAPDAPGGRRGRHAPPEQDAAGADSPSGGPPGRLDRHPAAAVGFPYDRPAAGAPADRPDRLSWPVNGHPAPGFPYHRPAPDAPDGELDRLSWPVNGHPAPGFPYHRPAPDAPDGELDRLSWPVNGHPAPGTPDGKPDRLSWPVNGRAGRHLPPGAVEQQPVEQRPAMSPDALGTPEPAVDATQLLRRYVPAQEVLGREAEDAGPRRRTGGPEHPPRAVVRRRRARRRALEWPFLILFALISAYLIRSYVVQTFYIPSGSMHETLLEGDRVLVDKVSYRLHDVHRGDVVVFRRPPDFPVEDDDLIKRVVALAGETVEARGGTVYVDGAALTEQYVEPACRGTRDFPRITVPAGTLWVMGDNRCNSSDSRVFGPVNDDLLVGRAFVLAWPAGRLSWL